MNIWRLIKIKQRKWQERLNHHGFFVSCQCDVYHDGNKTITHSIGICNKTFMNQKAVSQASKRAYLLKIFERASSYQQILHIYICLNDDTVLLLFSWEICYFFVPLLYNVLSFYLRKIEDTGIGTIKIMCEHFKWMLILYVYSSSCSILFKLMSNSGFIKKKVTSFQIMERSNVSKEIKKYRFMPPLMIMTLKCA